MIDKGLLSYNIKKVIPHWSKHEHSDFFLSQSLWIYLNIVIVIISIAYLHSTPLQQKDIDKECHVN